MVEILFRCNDIKMPKNGTLTLVVHPNGDVYLGGVLKDIKIGKTIELPPHGRLGDLDRVRERLGDDTFICYACRRLLDDVFDTAPTIVEASECQKK